jgi:hypothetical protein
MKIIKICSQATYFGSEMWEANCRIFLVSENSYEKNNYADFFFSHKMRKLLRHAKLPISGCFSKSFFSWRFLCTENKSADLPNHLQIGSVACLYIGTYISECWRKLDRILLLEILNRFRFSPRIKNWRQNLWSNWLTSGSTLKSKS